MTLSLNLSSISTEVSQVISLCTFLLISACILQFIISKINEKIPISIIWFLYGMLSYGIAISLKDKLYDPLTKSILNLRHIDNSILYYIVLPILLYEATQEVNWHAFKNFIIGGIGLAVFGVCFQVAILGLLFHYTLLGSSGISMSISFLIASIICSTDPVAILAILTGVSAPPKLSAIFNGESLINDGSSVLLFQFFYLLSIGDSGTPLYYASLFSKLLLFSPLLGIFMAALVSLWISAFHSHHYAQCITLMCGGYIIYFLSEYIANLSGPLTIVCYGIFIKAIGIVGLDRDAHDKHLHLLQGMCFIANSLVFMISGVVTLGMIATSMTKANAFGHCIKLGTMFLYLNLARTLMILIFMPLLNYIGYGINMKELFLLVWGGLRGAIVLVLALRIEGDPNVSKELSNTIAFYISGSVLLILVFQGFTFEIMYRILNPYKPNPFRMVYLEKVMKFIQYYYTKEMNNLENYWLFKGIDIIKYADQLVPKVTTMTWSKHGLLHLTLPSVHKVMSELTSNDNELLYNIDKADSFDFANIDADQNIIIDPNAYMSLFNQGLTSSSFSNFSKNFDPKFNLRLLGRATAYPPRKFGTKNLMHQDSTTNDLLRYATQNSYVYNNQSFPVRQGTDATIVFDRNDSYIGNAPRYSEEPISLNLLNMPPLTPVMSLDSGSSDAEIPEETAADLIFDSTKTVLKEREGELFIMIFNACNQMYKTLYENGYIDGGALLSLQKTVDIASDFALNKLKNKSIEAWSNVLNDFNNTNSQLHNWISQSKDINSMDGFEFEWLVLKKNLSWNFLKYNSNTSFGSFFFSNENKSEAFINRLKLFFKWLRYRISYCIISIIFGRRVAKYELEMLVAFVDSHQRILLLGGPNFEKLIGKTLLCSLIKQLRIAQNYMRVLIKKYPDDIKMELIRIAAFMLIRIKSSIVRTQVENGLLMFEDSDRILNLMSQQCYNISKYRQGILKYAIKSFSFKGCIDRLLCRRRASGL